MSREVTFLGDQIGKQPQALYEKIFKNLADKYDVDTVVSVCHGRYEAAPAEMSFDKLYIFVQLLPKEVEGIKAVKLKGFKISGSDIIFQNKIDEKNPEASPCPQGDAISFTKLPARAIIIPDDNGVPMAIMLDGALYFVNDFIHSRNKADFDSGSIELEYVLDLAIKGGLIDSVKSGLEEKSKRALESALRLQFTQRLDKELIQLKAASDTIATYEKGITDAVRKIQSTGRIVEAIRANIADVEKALQKTWKSLDRMANSTLYNGISYTKSGIKAITTPIFIKHGSKEHDLGKFEVSLGFDGTCKIVTLGTKIEGKFDHPHINDGQVCWGNFSGQIPKLIGSSEFDVALDMIYTFLTHYDSGNPYKALDYWPLKKKEKEVVKEMEVSF